MPQNKDFQFYNGNERLKAASVRMKFTPEQIAEIARCSEDAIYFFETYIKIIHVDRGVIPFEPWEFQKDLIRKIIDNRFVLARWGRQIGKSTTVAAMLLWHALFNKRYTIAILAHKMEQAQEILYRIQESFQLLPHWLQQGVVEWNKRSMSFENGSRIFAAATSSGSIRGKSLNILFCDEFSHVDRNMQEEFFTSVVPTISSGTTTKFIITTTPKGMDLFYKLWTESEQGRNDYVLSYAPWYSVPGRDEEWKKREIAKTSEMQFAQEHEIEFLGSTNTLVAAWKLKILTWLNPYSVVDNVTIFKKAEPKRHYVCCVDSSEGLNQDYHAVTIIDATCIPYEVVAVYRSNDMHHLLLPNIVYNLCKLYNEAVCLIEAMSTGAQIATILLHDLEYEGVLTTTLKGRNGQRIGGGSGDMRLGVQMNKQVKRIGCTNLKALIEDDKIVLNDERIVKELFTFVVKDTHGFAAEEGHNDDLVMSLVLFAWLVSQNFFKDSTDTDVRQSLYDQNIARIEQDLTPFGFITDGVDDTIEEQNVITYNPGLVYY
jgi:hypothetical protein